MYFILHLLPRIQNLLTQYSGEDHFDVFDEGVVAVVVAVQADLVRIDDVIVIPDGDLLVGAGFQLGKGVFG